jgi:hypothetical protein
MGNCDWERPSNYNYDFHKSLLHNALTTGHYNLWTQGKEWKKRFITLCIIFHMVFGLLCTNCLHDRLVTKAKTQPWLRGPSTTQLQGGTPLPHAMGEAALTHVENPNLLILGFACKHYKYHVLWLTQGLWHPNLAYPRLNITTKKRTGLAEEVKVPTSIGVSSPWPPP